MSGTGPVGGQEQEKIDAGDKRLANSFLDRLIFSNGKCAHPLIFWE